MLEVEVAFIAHDEQTSRLEIVIEHAPRLRFAANRHAPRGSKTHERHRCILGTSLDMIAVGCNAIVAIAIKIQTGRGKRHTAKSFDERPHPLDRRGDRWIVKCVRCHQARNIDHSIVHWSTFRAPLDARSEFVEPGADLWLIEKRTLVDDATGRVVDERLDIRLRKE